VAAGTRRLSRPSCVPASEQEQNQLAHFVTEQTSRFDALTAEAQKAIDLLQERRTAIISAAVHRPDRRAQIGCRLTISNPKV